MTATRQTAIRTGLKKAIRHRSSAIDDPSRRSKTKTNALGNPPPNTSSPEGAKELPQGWSLLSFEEAVQPISDEGKRVDQSEYLPEGVLPVIDQGEPFIGGYTNASDQKYEGPLPVVAFGDHTRRVKLVDFPFVVGAQGVKLFRPRKCWQPTFFAHLLPTLPIPDRGYGRHYQFVRRLSFPCPPLDEQRRIVAEIEKQFTRLEAGVAALQRVQANLIGVEESELAKLLVRAGDLLIVEGNGSKDQIGRLAIWDGSIDSCVHQNHLIKVRSVEPRMPKWILHWLQSPGGRQFVELVASSTSGLFTLSVNKVGNLLIPLPPLAEQTRIVAEVERRLSVVEELESVVTANLQRASRLRQSILQKAFTGELV